MSDLRLMDKDGDGMSLVEVDGYRMSNFGRTATEQAKVVRNIVNLPCLVDDIYIFGPMKSGTHWTWEIISMLVNGKAEHIPKSKSKQMLEYEEATSLEAVSSPRVLNSHLKIDCLPLELFNKKCKIVFILRNPKDVLASWYNHVKGITFYNYDGKWSNFFDLFMKDELDYGSWFDYVHEWEQLMKDQPELPIQVVYYEDLQQNIKAEIKKLAKFLGTPADDTFVDAIAEQCSFNKMKVNKKDPAHIQQLMFKGDFSMYRKGMVGDWKNWFTVSQNERFDAVFQEKMKNSSFRFNFSL